jgi:hypothetical protein
VTIFKAGGRSKRRIAWLILLSTLIGAGVPACRTSRETGHRRASGFIAVHADAREVLAAFESKDPNRLSRALRRLAEVSGQPGLLSTGDPVRRVDISPGGRYLLVSTGESLGGSRILLFDARSARLDLTLNGYGASLSDDDRWLACLQHRYTTARPGADVSAYESLLLVDLDRVRGAASDDENVFRTLVNDLEGQLRGGRTRFTKNDQIEVVRDNPPLKITYTRQGKIVEPRGRRWKFLKLF